MPGSGACTKRSWQGERRMSLEEAHHRLDRALESGRAGDMAACKRFVKEALAKAPQTSELWLRAARAFYEFRQYREALTCVAGALSLDDVSLENHRMHFELQWRLGRFQEALVSAEHWLSRERFRPEGFVQVAKLLHGFGDHEGALQWGERGLAVAPRSTALHEMVVQSLSVLGRQERLTEAVSRWFSSPAVSTEDRLKGIVCLHEAGCHSEASTHLARTASTSPAHAGVLALQARTAFWAMELVEAQEKSTQALSQDPDEPFACLVAGGLAVLKGEGGLASEQLQGALRNQGTEVEARVWLAEAFLLTGDGQAAQEAAQRAVALSNGSLLTAEVVGLLARFQVDALQSANSLDRSVYGAVATKLLPLSPDFDVVWEGQVKAVRALLQFALERFGGNRGSALTVVEPEGGSGSFGVYDVPVDPFFRGQQIRMLLRTRSVEEVVERLDGLVTSFSDHPGGWLVRGHVHRASGNLDRAGEDYAQSLARDAHDCAAKVGLASVLVLSGEKEEGLASL
jgi:tetratricopeptide (TPR) repeat protein